MGVRLDQQEIDEFLGNGHTLILTTVDKDGYPHSTPIWYVYTDGAIYTRGRRRSQKTANIRRNPKVSCLVEEGERWRELKAVMIRGRAEEVTDPAEQERFQRANAEKYDSFPRVPNEPSQGDAVPLFDAVYYLEDHARKAPRHLGQQEDRAWRLGLAERGVQPV